MSPEPLSLFSIAVIMLALAAGCFVKGIVGSGLPMIAIPVMASFLGVEHAVVVIVIPGIVTNAWLLWVHRAEAATATNLPAMLLAGVLGVVLGSWALSAVSERTLSLTLAASIGAYLFLLLVHPQFSLSRTVDRYVSPVVGVVAGLMQGATGMSGPIVATYFHALRLRQSAYVFSVTATFQVFFLSQMVALYQLGMFTRERLLEGLLALVPVVIALPISLRFARLISRRVFDGIVITLVTVMGLRFLYRGLLGG